MMHPVNDSSHSVASAARAGRRQRRRPMRRGASMIETAITLMLFIVLVFGMLDLGLWVFRHHILAQTARQIARQAIVHGSLAEELGSWGPTTLSGTAAINTGGDPADPDTQIRAIANRALVGFNPNQVTYEVQWPDGGNDPQEEHRVRVSLTTPYSPIMTFIFGNPSFDLSATSVMHIAH